MTARFKTAFLLGALGLLQALPAAASKTTPEARRLLERGAKSLGEQDYESAIRLLQRATSLDSGSAEAFFQLGNAYYQRAFQTGPAPEKADKADARQTVSAYQTALTLGYGGSSSQEAYVLQHGLAMCYETLGRYDDALDALKRAMELSPGNPMPALYAARLRYERGDLADATANFRLSVERARRIKGYKALARLVRTHPMFSALARAPQHKSLLEAYDLVEQGAITESEAGQRVAEMQEYRDSLNQGSSTALRRRSLGSVEAAKLAAAVEAAHGDFRFGRFEDALEGYRRALEENAGKEALDAAQKSRVLENMGICYRRLGLAQESTSSLEAAAKERPNASAYYQLALTYSNAGQFPKALSALDRSLYSALSAAELRKMLLLARTDPELDPVRDLPHFQRMLQPHLQRLKSGVN